MSFKLFFPTIVLIIIAAFVYADSQDELDYKPGELIVRFDKDKGKSRTLNEKQTFIDKKGGGKIKKSYKRLSDLHVIKLPENLKVKDALKKYKGSKEILYVEPNYKIYLHSTIPNDPYFPQLWGLHNTGQEHPLTGGGTAYGTEDADIDAPEAWDIYTGNQNIIVAVLDTGIDYNHPDLAANMWVNQAELVGDPNSDDDGNGYRDDIYGFDFADYDSDPNDYYLHGTHVAGTIGAVGNNNIGVSGVCWNVKLMSVKIFPNYDESPSQSSFMDVAIEGINYAVDNGATILNNSWGGYVYGQSLKDAINDAKDAGVLFVASAGNDWEDNDNPSERVDYTPMYPASYDCENIISVLATNSIDEKPDWSNYGIASVDIGAPGEDIFSTFPTYRTAAFYGLEYWYGRPFSTFYETISGTSMAAPHVAGACALIWSMYPNLTAVEVKQIILDSADRLDSLNNLCVSGGRLNLHQALLHAHPLDLEIQDDIADPDGCVIPDDEITFTITYGNPTLTNPDDPNYWGPAYDTQIHFPLPSGVDYTNLNDPNYSVYDRMYIWDIGTVSPGDSNSVSLTVRVNQNAEPVGKIKSKVKMYSSIGYGEANEDTRICCWGGDRIYVNAYAGGYETGQSWPNAYKDLQKAMERAQKSCGNEIWVAHGIYTPTKTRNQNISFDMVNGLKLYGGFTGSEDALENRDFVAYRTYLSGNIDIGGGEDSYIVVNTAPGITGGTVLDGFVITHSTVAGVKCNRADLTIQNCVIADNDANGINVYQSSPSILDSIIANNGAVGVYDCNESDVMIDRCIISQNGGAGLYCTRNAKASVTSTWIHNNQLDGITFSSAASGALVRNNTIVCNKRYGINLVQGSSPTITNCIVWDNAVGDLLGCDATYSCFDYGYQGLGNINYDPYFAYNDPNNIHLAWNSPCKNTGNPYLSYENQFDIDGEGRVADTYVDIGADEVNCEDISHPLDWNADGIVNLVEFNAFSQAWLSRDPNDPSPSTDPNDFPGWDPRCDLNSDYNVNLPDLIIFVEDTPWLWTACWRRTDKWLFTFGNVQSDTDDMQQMMAPVGGGEEMLVSSASPEPALPEAEEMETAAPIETAIVEEQPTVEEMPVVEEQSMMPDPNTPAIYLVYDGDMTPDPNTEVTVYVYTEATLFAMGAAISVIGDANIITAMGEADCTEYGWNNGWNSDPYIDNANDFLCLSGVSWPGTATETVSYFTFIYHSGEVSISFITEDDWSCAFDSNFQLVPFSGDALVLGRDPNEP